MNLNRAVKIWDELGVEITPEYIRADWERICRWKNKRPRCRGALKGAEREANQQTAVTFLYQQPYPNTIPTPTRKGEPVMRKQDVFKSKFIKAEDLNGEPVTLTINAAEVQLVGPDKEEKMVVGFKGGKYKSLILNSTNWDLLVAATGQDDSEKWVGKKIQLRTEKVRFRNQMVDAIRVVVPAGKIKQQSVDLADDVPF